MPGAGKSGTGHCIQRREGGRGAGWVTPAALSVPGTGYWVRHQSPATGCSVLSAGPGAGVPPTKMSRGHYLAGGGGCAGLGLDWDRYYWYNLIIQKNKYILTYL